MFVHKGLDVTLNAVFSLFKIFVKQIDSVAFTCLVLDDSQVDFLGFSFSNKSISVVEGTFCDEELVLIESGQPLHSFIAHFKVSTGLFVETCGSDEVRNHLVVSSHNVHGHFPKTNDLLALCHLGPRFH